MDIRKKKALIENDNKDRETIRTRLQTCIDSLDPEKYTQHQILEDNSIRF